MGFTSGNLRTSFIRIPGVILDTLSVDTTPTTNALGDIVLPDYVGTLVAAYISLIPSVIYDTSGSANNVDGAQKLQVDNVAAGGWLDAMDLPHGMFLVDASSRQHGTPLSGTDDIKIKCAPGDTLSVQWLSSAAAHDDLRFKSIQCELWLVVR